MSSRVPVKIKIVVFILIGVYFFIPTDVLPDYLPLLGIADELSFLFLVFRFLLNKYNRKLPISPPPLVVDAEVVE